MLIEQIRLLASPVGGFTNMKNSYLIIGLPDLYEIQLTQSWLMSFHNNWLKMIWLIMEILDKKFSGRVGRNETNLSKSDRYCWLWSRHTLLQKLILVCYRSKPISFLKLSYLNLLQKLQYLWISFFVSHTVSVVAISSSFLCFHFL